MVTLSGTSKISLTVLAALLLPIFSSGSPSSAPQAPRSQNHTIEIRSYNLKPGTRDAFNQLFLQRSMPLLQKFKVDVVAYGPSLADKDTYFLIRAYPSVEERQKSEDTFYGSDDWTKGPREAIMADIENYTTVVVQLDDAAIAGLRKLIKQ